jgi:exodeoxyribonuclease VII large subunit
MSGRVIPVGLLASYIREVLEADPILGGVWVEGEVANVFAARSGHVYFTIKDDEGQLKCALFKGQASRQRYLPRQGDQVAANGRVSLYEREGALQLYVDVVQPAGIGILALQLEQLRQRLEAEGLFEATRKRPLPATPRVIGVVTSPDGAVWHDIQNVLGRRYPLVEVVLAPAPVQGDRAPAGLLAALAALEADPRVEVVILARGGGSPQDLWAFNDETLARAVFACRIPVVTGIGHETDWTLVDWVADLRAPTPSAAAELCTPSVTDIAERLSDCRQRLDHAAAERLGHARLHLDSGVARLDRASPKTATRDARTRVSALRDRLDRSQRGDLDRRRLALTASRGVLAALEPRRVLARGYAVVSASGSERPLSRAADVVVGQPLVAQLADGRLQVVVESAAGSAAADLRPGRGPS